MAIKPFSLVSVLFLNTFCAVLCSHSMAQTILPSRCEAAVGNQLTVERNNSSAISSMGMQIKRTPYQAPVFRPNGTAVPMGNHVGTSHSTDKLIYVYAGRGILKFADREFEIQKGSIIFIPAGNSYRYDSTGEELVTMETYNSPLDEIYDYTRAWTKSPRAPLVTQYETLEPWSEWQSGNPVLTRFAVKSAGDYKETSMIFGFAKIPPGKELKRHRHPDDHDEAYYILEGEATSFINDQEYKLPAGQGLYIEGGAYHQTQNRGDKDLIFFFVFTNEKEFSNVEYIIEAN